jgi:hypothetical protein
MFEMKSVVLGKVIENHFSVEPKTEPVVDEHGEEKVVYTGKPVLIETPKVKEWKEICSFEGEPRYNKHNTRYLYVAFNDMLNISEDESVVVNNEIFRADLNELHLQTDKVMKELDVDKEKSTYEYEAHIEQFNKMMNTSNKAMQDYCDLHGLDCRKADCEKVFSLVYPGKKYKIKDGKMDCMPDNEVYYTCKLAVCDSASANNTVLSSTVDTAIYPVATISDYISAR